MIWRLKSRTLLDFTGRFPTARERDLRVVKLMSASTLCSSPRSLVIRRGGSTKAGGPRAVGR